MDENRWLPLVRQLEESPYRFGVIEHGTPDFRVQFDAGLTVARAAVSSASPIGAYCMRHGALP